MTHTAPSRRLLPFALLALFTSFAVSADRPAIPEPKVIASIVSSPSSPTACIATLEVRLPETDEILAAPKIAIAAGQEATTTTSDGSHKVEITVKAASGCAGGTYDVRILAKGTITHAKKGSLQSAAK